MLSSDFMAYFHLIFPIHLEFTGEYEKVAVVLFFFLKEVASVRLRAEGMWHKETGLKCLCIICNFTF